MQVEQLLDALDDRAVRVSCGDRRDLLFTDRNHGLVEERHSLRDLGQVDEASALTDPGQGRQLPIAELFTDLRGVAETGVPGPDIAFERGP